ncbi:MAG: DUF3093 domain-containing protein [Actinobacteria bacterium]|nr:DUF3093 domain-containing protein [Actinomycetota bacterium]
MADQIFFEKLRPPFWLLAFIYFLFCSLALSVWAALGNLPGLITILLLTLALIWARRAMTMSIVVTDQQLYIGRAHIERKYLAKVTILMAPEMLLTRGRNADPSAFLAIRFWENKGIKVELNDKADPTPYWLISSRKCDELARALKS